MNEADENKRLIIAFVEAINRREWKALERLVAPDFRRHSYAAGVPGVQDRAQLVEYLKRELETFPDARESIQDMVSEGSKVSVRHRFEGTQRGPLGPHPASGREMISEYIAIYRIERGHIAEAWAEWDNLSGLAQLGHLAAPQQHPRT